MIEEKSEDQKARAFVQKWPLLLMLNLANKAGAYPSEVTYSAPLLMCAPCLALQILDLAKNT